MKVYRVARAMALAVLFAGCDVASSTDEVGSGSGGSVQSPIVGGTSASESPEAALIEMSTDGVIKAACSGAVIAPRVVLTAGHCVAGFTGWRVRAPFREHHALTASARGTL